VARPSALIGDPGGGRNSQGGVSGHVRATKAGIAPDPEALPVKWGPDVVTRRLLALLPVQIPGHDEALPEADPVLRLPAGFLREGPGKP
jgi:hypothetical protein